MIGWARFDANEWFVLTLLVAGIVAVGVLPRKVSKGWLALGLLWGFASSTLFDFTIGGGMLDFYIVNDSERYEITDLFTYLAFAPFGYFFINFYELLNLKKQAFWWYIPAWTVVGVVFQWAAESFGMTMYQNGYKLEYNIPVFLFIQSVSGLFYVYAKSKGGSRRS